MRLVVAITGATGAIFGIRILERLRELGVETHLCMSKWGQRTVEYETETSVAEVRALATASYGMNDQAAAISSGSFRHDGMIVAPCSMRTLAAVAHGLCDNLIARAADVTLKERRPLVLLTREAPLSEIHIENMLRVTRAGAIVLPPVPAFYHRPGSIDDIVDHVVYRTLDCVRVEDPRAQRWAGGLRPPLPADPL